MSAVSDGLSDRLFAECVSKPSLNVGTYNILKRSSK